METTEEIVERMIENFVSAFKATSQLELNDYLEYQKKWKDESINQFYEDLIYLEDIESEYLPVILMMEEKLKTICDCNENE